MPTNKPRYTITVDKELQKRIEDYQFDNRFKSQTKAIISLLDMALKQVQFKQITKTKPEISKEEELLLENYRKFNQEGKEKILSYLSDLSENPRLKKCDMPELVQEA